MGRLRFVDGATRASARDHHSVRAIRAGRGPTPSSPVADLWRREIATAGAVHPDARPDPPADRGRLPVGLSDAPARDLQHPVRAAACTGLRVSEAIRLRFDDITPDGLVIRRTKFRKSR